MKFRLIYQPPSPNAQSPIRVVEQTTSREVTWINRYLDREFVRRLADKTLRTYAHNLLHFVAGGRVFTIPTTSCRLTYPSPSCWITCASSPTNNRGLPAPPSMTASPSQIAPSTAHSQKLPVRWLGGFIRLFYTAGPWV